MFCPKCGNELNENASFCTVCGEKISPVQAPKKQFSNKTVWIAAGAGVLVVILLVALIVGLSGKGKKNAKPAAATEPASEEFFEPEPEPVQLQSPQLEWVIDGEHAIVYWNPVQDAEYYRADFGGQTYEFSDTYFDIKTFEGDSLDVSVVADSSNEYCLTSASSDVHIDVPVIDSSQDNYYFGTLMSLDQLEFWVSSQGYEYEIVDDPENSLKELIVSIKDDENSGWFNRGKRIANSAWHGFTDSMDEQMDNIDGDEVIGNIIGNSLQSGSLRQGYNDTFDEMEQDMEAEAKGRGFLAGLDAWLEDTDIHYIYIYSADATEYACRGMVLEMEKTRHEDVIAEFMDPQLWNELEAGKHYSTTFFGYNRDMYVDIGEDHSNNLYPKWVIGFHF